MAATELRRGVAIAVATVCLGWLGRAADAQDREPWQGVAAAKLFAYGDTDDTAIVSSLTDAEISLPEGIEIGGHVLVDVVSAASVDVVSAATAGFSETRLELGARANKRVSDRSVVGLAYGSSVENDWKSYSVQATATTDRNDANTKLGVGYSFVHNQVGRAGDPVFDERLLVHTLEPSLAQIINDKTLINVSATFQVSSGYHSSPYRFARTAGDQFSLPESHPDLRLRGAASVRVLRYVRSWLGAELTYRLYGDDWGVTSHTGLIGLRSTFFDSWDVAVRGRVYWQSDASFWRESYPGPMEVMSADRELSNFYDLGGGGRVAWRHGSWTVDGKLDAIYYRFLNFAPLQRRLAFVAGLGTSFTW